MGLKWQALFSWKYQMVYHSETCDVSLHRKNQAVPRQGICRCAIFNLKKKKGLGMRVEECLCGGSSMGCYSGKGWALWCNISMWRIRVVWGKIRHREITALFSVSARVSGGAATQRLCQHSWGSTPAEGFHLSPLLPKYLIREAHRTLLHHYPPLCRFFSFNNQVLLV